MARRPNPEALFVLLREVHPAVRSMTPEGPIRWREWMQALLDARRVPWLAWLR